MRSTECQIKGFWSNVLHFLLSPTFPTPTRTLTPPPPPPPPKHTPVKINVMSLTLNSFPYELKIVQVDYKHV